MTAVAFVVPGALVGAVFAFVTALLLITAQINAMQTTVNGWSITMTQICDRRPEAQTENTTTACYR